MLAPKAVLYSSSGSWEKPDSTTVNRVPAATGFLLGGSIGVGTVVYALSIGPLVHFLLPLFTVRLKTQPAG